MSEIHVVAPPEGPSSTSKPATSLPKPPRGQQPSLHTLQSWLPLYIKRVDRTVAQLSRMLSTPSGTDKVLMIVGYSTLAASSVLQSVSLVRLQNAARRLVSAAMSLPANTTLLIDTAAIPTPRLLRLSQSLKALSDLISDFRIFARLWGLLGIWQWGKSLVDNPPADVTLKRIAWAQVLVNVLYQYLENGAYLASKGVLGWSAEQQGRAWVWSSRFWAAHVGLEFGRLGYQWRVRQLQKKTQKQAVKGVESTARDHSNDKTWTRDMVSNLAYAPLTVHWSVEKGFIGDLGVGVLGTTAGAAAFLDLWANAS